MVMRIFNGKQYRRITSYRTKKTAQSVAAENRRGGWNARVVNENGEWWLYTRKILRDRTKYGRAHAKR